jgi:hypothetical protein
MGLALILDPVVGGRPEHVIGLEFADLVEDAGVGAAVAGAVAFEAVEFGLGLGGVEGVALFEDLEFEVLEADEGPSGVDELAEEVCLKAFSGFDLADEFVLVIFEFGLFVRQNGEGFGRKAVLCGVLG